VTYQLKLAALTSTDLTTFPVGRNAVAFLNVNLFPTEQAAATFASDAARDLESKGHSRLGVVPGVPNSTVIQGTQPLPDPAHPGATLVTTYFHAVIGPTTLQASFNCVNCPVGQIASDQQDLYTPFINALTPILPTPGSSIEEHRSANVWLVTVGVVVAIAGLAIATWPLLRRSASRSGSSTKRNR
jgi:hypothetical protein